MASWKHRLHEIVFEADTPSGKAFDITLLIAIVMSVATVMLESVAEIQTNYGPLLITLEWFFTILFTIEYIARLASVGRPSRYAVSFFGIVDLLSILPTYLSVIFAGAQSLLIIRVFRLLRIFRVLKLRHYLTAAQVLDQALRGSRLTRIIRKGSDFGSQDGVIVSRTKDRTLPLSSAGHGGRKIGRMARCERSAGQLRRGRSREAR